MVVIIIIGILAAIAIPSYQKYTTNAKVAETYSILENLGKAQISYFAENQEFYNLILPPMPINLDAKVVTSDTSWNTIGYPAPIGSNLNFIYRIFAGKTDSSGTELNATLDSISGTGFIVSNNASLIRGLHADSTTCNAGILRPTNLGISPVANYDWFIVTAVADMNNDFTNTCTAVARALHSSATTQGPSYIGGFVIINLGL